jgi:hypothetical protein
LEKFFKNIDTKNLLSTSLETKNIKEKSETKKIEHNLFFQKLWKQKDLSKEKYQKQKIGQKLAENVYQQTLEIKFRKNEKRRINILNNNNKKNP